MNRREFMAGLLASAFALSADATIRELPPAVPLSGIDLLPVSGKKPTSMLVLLHGFGGNGEQMRPTAAILARMLPDTIFVLPDAPEQCRDNTDPTSRQWFGIRALDSDHAARVAGIRATHPVLDAYIEQKLSQYGLGDHQLVIGGFSQGAMMALHTALYRPQGAAAVVSFNGMLVDHAGVAAARLARTPVLALHGRQDTVVPYAQLGVLEAALRQAGVPVETARYNVGHSVTPAGLRRAGEFVARALTEAAKPMARIRRILGK